jgi:hypothetical protein
VPALTCRGSRTPFGTSCSAWLCSAADIVEPRSHRPIAAGRSAMHLVCTPHAPGAYPCALAQTRMKCLTAELSRRGLNISSCSPWRVRLRRSFSPKIAFNFLSAIAHPLAGFLHGPAEQARSRLRPRGFVAFFAMVSRHGTMPRSPGSSWVHQLEQAAGQTTMMRRKIGANGPKGDIKRPACLSIHCLAIRTTTSDGSSGGPIDAIATTSATMLAQTMARKMRSIGRQRPCDPSVPPGRARPETFCFVNSRPLSHFPLG